MFPSQTASISRDTPRIPFYPLRNWLLFKCDSPALAGGGPPTFSAPNNLPPGVTVASLPAKLQGGTPFTYRAENLKGYPLVRAPNWTATAGFHYEMPVGNEMKLGLGSDLQYSSKYTTISASPRSGPISTRNPLPRLMRRSL